MLILTRNIDEEIVLQLDGEEIIIKILSIKAGQVKLGFVAPKSVTINRKEIHERIMAEKNINSQTGE